ncbi:hypothetical protein MVEG_09503 [Podila verticillata NRRL 6337]|nr:hypothetical protein MVEG_09503 [Podila verticillata NRRL 6337]
MSTPDVISPAPVASSTRAHRSSHSVAPRPHQQKFGSNSRRHTIAQPPSSRDSTVFTPQSGVIASLFPIMITPNHNNKLFNHKSGASVGSIIMGQKLPQFFDRQVSASSEREKREREQPKEAIQMSTVNDQGTFLPPPPAEKGFLKDRFKDTDQDHFDTITRTPPERVKTFLSTAHRISPGNEHSNGNRIKRGAIPASFVRISTTTTTPPVEPSQNVQQASHVVAVRPLPSRVATVLAKPTSPKLSSLVSPPTSYHTTPSSAEASLATPPASPRTSAASVHTTDITHATPLPVPRSRITIEQYPSRRNTLVYKEELSPLKTRTRAQMSFLTGDLDKPSEEMEDALSDLITPSSPSTVSGDESLSSSWSETTWSTASSPKHSTFASSMKVVSMPVHASVVVGSKKDIQQMNAKKLRDMNFGGALGVAH